MRRDDAEEASVLIKRVPLLAAMRSGPLDRNDLQARFELARTTVYRATVDLEERRLIERTTDGYELTPEGVAVVESSDRFLESLRASERLRPLLELVDDPRLTGSLYAFADAEVIVADERDPYRPVHWWIDATESVDRLRVLTVSAGRREGFETTGNRVDDGADVEVVFTPDALTGAHRVAPDIIDAFVREAPGRAFVHPDLPFTLAIFDDTTAIMGTDERTGIPAVCAVTDAVDAREWATRVYNQYRREAEPVTVADLGVEGPDPDATP